MRSTVIQLRGSMVAVSLAVFLGVTSMHANADDIEYYRGLRSYTMHGYGMSQMMGNGYGYSMGPGMMGGYGMSPGMMGGGYGMGPGMMQGNGYGYGGPMSALNLSDEQRTAIRKIQEEQRKQYWQMGAQIMDAQSRLYEELYDHETPSPKKVGAAYSRVASLQQKLLESQVSMSNRLRAVLTDEQREQLQQWQHGYQGGGYGPRGGNNGPGNMPGPGMMRR